MLSDIPDQCSKVQGSKDILFLTLVVPEEVFSVIRLTSSTSKYLFDAEKSIPVRPIANIKLDVELLMLTREGSSS